MVGDEQGLRHKQPRYGCGNRPPSGTRHNHGTHVIDFQKRDKPGQQAPAHAEAGRKRLKVETLRAAGVGSGQTVRRRWGTVRTMPPRQWTGPLGWTSSPGPSHVKQGARWCAGAAPCTSARRQACPTLGECYPRPQVQGRWGTARPRAACGELIYPCYVYVCRARRQRRRPQPRKGGQTGAVQTTWASLKIRCPTPCGDRGESENKYFQYVQ